MQSGAELAGARTRSVLRATLRTVFLYGLLVWIYLAVNSLTHPETLPKPLTHLLPWPTEAETAALSFVLSAAAFLALRASRLRTKAVK
jgi:hypothetical protein